jgi:TPR repeat protein
MKVIALLFLSLLLLPTVACAGQFEDGQDAYASGNYQAALKLWRPLAEQGNAQAQSRIGWMKWNGIGVKPDVADAVKWYRKAANRGDAKAEFNLGMMYWWGMGSVPKDYAEAAKWFRKSADQGDATAQTSLGVMYEHGVGVTQDYVQAYMWFILAKAAGNKSSAISLDEIAAKMPPGKIAEAKRLADAWRQIPAAAAKP